MRLFKKNKFIIGLITIYLVYLVFALAGMHKPLVADDTAFAIDAGHKQFGLVGLWHPPLYFDILRVLRHHFGVTSDNLRFFGIFCFLLTLSLIYSLSKTVSQDKRAGILACLLFATHPLAIQGSLVLDIDNTILTVLLTLAVFYFVKTHNSLSLKYCLFSGLLFFICLWAKLSTPLIFLLSVLVFYILKGGLKKGIGYALAIGTIGAGLFLFFWAAYARVYNLNFLSVFERSVAVINRGVRGPTLPAAIEMLLRFIRIALWMGPYFCLLWTIIFIKRLKDYLIDKRAIETKDLFLIYSGFIFISYFFVGGVSYGFAKYQYPALPVLAIFVADFVLGLKPKFSKREIILFLFVGLAFIAVEKLYIGDLLYRINYLLRKIAIFTPEKTITFFIDLGLRVACYFLVFCLALLFLKRVAWLLLILTLIVNFSYDFRQMKTDYFTTYCYGRKIKDYQQLTGLFKSILSRRKDALIIGPDDVLFNAGLERYSLYNYSILWNDRQGFLRAIKDKRVACVTYSFSWNTLYTYKNIFFHPEVKKALEQEYKPSFIGEYAVWMRN